MTTEITLNNKQLASILGEWFKINEDQLNNNRNFWDRDAVAIVIKENLQKAERWNRKKRAINKKASKPNQILVTAKPLEVSDF